MASLQKSDKATAPEKAAAPRIAAADIIDGSQPDMCSGDHEKHGAASTTTFDPVEQARVRRKLDWVLVPLASLMFLFCFIDRANIGNARLASFETDLGLKGNDFNSVNSIFFISYIVFEIPCVLLYKEVGPGWYLPVTAMAFGLVSVCGAFVHNYAELAGVRFVLGITEAGVMPGLSYYLSRWYTRAELTFRLSIYISMAAVSGAVGGVLASGILKIQSFGSFGAGSWRNIFAVEGIITIAIGILALILLPDRPETARFLTASEKKLVVGRLVAERIATSSVVDKMSFRKLWQGAANPVTLATALILLLESVTVNGLEFFAPTIVKTIFPQTSVIEQQLLTVHSHIFGAICIMAVCFYSWYIKTRQILIILTATPIMAGYVIFLATRNQIARYIATFLIASCAFTLGPLCHAQAAANVSRDSARSMSIATTMFFGNIGSCHGRCISSRWTVHRFSSSEAKVVVCGIYVLFLVERIGRRGALLVGAALMDALMPIVAMNVQAGSSALAGRRCRPY